MNLLVSCIMIWVVYIAFIIALGVLVMMREEIMTGFFRWRDYFIAASLLYLSAIVLFGMDSFVSALSSSWWPLVAPIRLLIAFGLAVVVWGGTLAVGALVLKLAAKSFSR